MFPLASNVQNIVAPFGELSEYSKSFARDKAQYTNGTDTDVQATVFSAKDGSNAYYVLTTETKDKVLDVGQWIYDQYSTGNIPVQASHAAFVSAFEAEFPSLAGVVIGPLVAGSGPTFNMPEYIEFVFTDVAHGSAEHTIKFWYIDAAFQAQYDEYLLIVIPPITPIDDLNQATAVVNPLLALRTSDILVGEINTAVGVYPATKLTTITLVWHDPTLPASTLTTYWTIVIYGAAGDNNDFLYEAIRNYISDNTVLNGGEWGVMYPGLYNVTEFTLIPIWDNDAIPGTLLDYELYSPTINPAGLKAKALVYTPPSYNDVYNLSTHLDNNLEMSCAIYRSLPFLAVANPANAGGIVRFSQQFPDYMVMPSTSGDYGRMENSTQNFISLFSDMLDKCLDLTPSSNTPPGYSKVVRNNKTFLAKTFEDVQYIVLSKYSYLNP